MPVKFLYACKPTNFLYGEILAFDVTTPLPAKLVVVYYVFFTGLKPFENYFPISDFKSTVKLGGFLLSLLGVGD